MIKWKEIMNSCLLMIKTKKKNNIKLKLDFQKLMFSKNDRYKSHNETMEDLSYYHAWVEKTWNNYIFTI